MKRLFCIFMTCIFLSTLFVAVSAEEANMVYTTQSTCYSENGEWYESGSLLGYTGIKTRVCSVLPEVNASWSITVDKNGYYRFSFYNVKHSSNVENINVTIRAGESEETMSFTHRGDYSDSCMENIGKYKLAAGDTVEVIVSAQGSGSIRTDSVMTEYLHKFSETVISVDDFQVVAGQCDPSGLVGYNGTESRFGGTDLKGYWKIALKNEGILDLYIYNMAHKTNCQKMNVKLCDSDGNIKSIQIKHNDDPQNAGLIYLGQFDYKQNGNAYVEVSAEGGDGFLRINTLVARMYEKEISEGEDDIYPKRTLVQKDVQLFTPSDSAKVIYVSPDGENGDGSRNAPYNSIVNAKTAVRDIINSGYPEHGIVVNLLSGTYVTDTLTFTDLDSGSEDSPVVWIASEGAVITSSQIIPRESFSLVTDQEILSRIPKSLHGSVYSVDISEYNPVEMNISSPYVVSFDDTPGELARFPNTGFICSGDLVDIGTRSDSGARQRGFTYRVNDDMAIKWGNEPNGYISGYWLTPYTMDTIKIASLDEDNLTISGASGTGLGAYENAQYYVRNMMCELDHEGEWYVENDVFYAVLPRECENVYLCCKNDGILKVDGANDIIFENISFKNCMGTAVEFINNPIRCGIIGGEVKNTSGGGVLIGGENCYIRDADISYVGGFGIKLFGGNEYILSHGGNYAENNTVTKTGRYMNKKSAVVINGCGNRLSNNHIYNVPTHGIIGGGMENIIEKNIVERTNLEMGDTGGIYFNNYGMGYGTVIRYNIVKDSVGIAKVEGFTDEGALGIYIDDLNSGIEVHGNVVYNAKEPGTFIHSGRYNNIHDNIYINCDTPIKIVKTEISKGTAENGPVWNNISLYNNDIINEKYPQAIQSLENLGDPVNNIVKNNVSFSSGKSEFESILDNYFGTYSGNVDIVGTPDCDMNDFYDLDFTKIKEECPDFEEIPISEIGTYTGGLRKNVEEVVFNNSCEPFSLISPGNGEKNVSRSVTLYWEDTGGIKESVVSVSENSDMSNPTEYRTDKSFLDITLESGKTYYWQVIKEPFLNYPLCVNSGDVYSFETISTNDEYEANKKSAEFLSELADETEFSSEDIKTLKSSLNNCDDADSLQTAIDTFFDARRTKTELDTVIFDDYSADTVGEKPFGLFQRSYSPLDITTASLSENNCVKFNDSGEYCHYTSRYFYPEKDYVEFATRVVPETNTGNFSMSIVESCIHATRDGITAGNAARVIFASDGKIYGDRDKRYQLMSYSANKSYDVKITLDIKNNSYSVYINNSLRYAKIPMGCDCTEVGSILYDTGDGTTAGNSKSGVYYIDDTVVRTPRRYGTNASLTGLYIDGIRTEIKDVLDIGINDETVIEYTAPESSHTKLVRENGLVYITVISGDFDRVKTYIIK